MKHHILALLVLAGLVPGVSAEAGTGRLTLVPPDWIAIGETLPRSDFSTLLRSTGDGSIYLSFALPKNYKNNTPVTVRMRLMSGDLGCNLLIVPASVGRMRIGQAADGGGGFTHNGPAVVASPAVGQIFAKKFTLKPASSGTLTTQKAGDGIVLMMTRTPLDPLDTCPGDVAVHYVDVIYQTK